jgi:hypothetical protein
VDGALKAVARSSNLTCSCNTHKESTGAHTIEAMADDAAGNKASGALDVNVRNTT